MRRDKDGTAWRSIDLIIYQSQQPVETYLTDSWKQAAASMMLCCNAHTWNLSE
jgi:glucose-6-phosphate 1-dehydrogenase